MLFNSNEKFLQNITDSFKRFGINEESSEQGSVKDTTRILMKDTIHDSAYVAIAKTKSAKKDAEKVWLQIIEEDLIPASMDQRNGGDIPAAAIIVPEDDINIVEKIFQSKDLQPTIYQIFDGYIVAGLKRSDVAKIIKEYTKTPSDGQAADKIDSESEDTENQIYNEEDSEQLTSNTDKPFVETDDDRKEYRDEDGIGSKNETNPLKKYSLASKVAAAALLGVGAGVVPFAVKTVMDKDDPAVPQLKEESAIEEKLPEASINAEKYLEALKEGAPADMELLKAIASNPALSREYLNKLADTPVGLDVIKNPSADEYLPLRAAASLDENRRAAAAQNPKMRPEDLFRLSSDKSAKVRQSLAKNPAISQDIMKKLAKDTDDVKRALLENPSLTPEILDEITNNTEPDCDFVQKMMANPCITPDMLRRNSVNADKCFRVGVAGNPNTPPEVLAGLIRDKDDEVMATAYTNPNIKQNDLDMLFPPDWHNAEGKKRDILAKKAALENPKLSKAVMEEALTSNPSEYGMNLAKNKSLPQELADEIGRMGSGRKGLRDFIKDTDELKTDKNFHREMKNESEQYGGDISIPLRKKLNADFANSVYDPARLATILNSINKRKSGINSRHSPLRGANSEGSAGKVSSLDKRGNAPVFFSKNAGDRLGGGFGNGEGMDGLSSKDNDDRDTVDMDDKGQAALKAADDIISDMMADVLPPVAKAVYGSAKPPKNSSSPYSGGSGSPWRALDTSKDNLFNMVPTQDILFKNACDRIDALQILF